MLFDEIETDKIIFVFISIIFVFCAFFRLLHINKTKNVPLKFMISSIIILLNTPSTPIVPFMET